MTTELPSAEAEEAARSKRSPWLRRGLAVAGYGAIVALAWRKLEPSTLKQGIASLHVWSVAVVLGISLLHIAARALRFHWLMRRAKAKDYSWIDGAAIFCVGLSTSAVTPARAGDLIKAKLVGAHGIPVSIGVGLVIAERLFDLLALTATMLMAYPFVASGDRQVYGRAALSLFVVELAFIAAISARPIRKLWIGALLRLVERVRSADARARVESAVEGFSLFWDDVFSSFGAAFGFFAFSLGAWAIEFLKLWTVLALMGDRVPPLVVLFVYPASLLAGILTLVPFSEGVVGVTTVVLLKSLAGLDPNRATVAVVVDRAASIIPPLALAGLFAVSRWRRKTQGATP